MWSVWVSTQNFYHGHILQDLSHQLFVTGGQLCIFQELPIMYLSWIMVGKIVYFLLPAKPSHHLLPNIPMECPKMIGFLRLWEKLLCDPYLLFTRRHQSQLSQRKVTCMCWSRCSSAILREQKHLEAITPCFCWEERQVFTVEIFFFLKPAWNNCIVAEDWQKRLSWILLSFDSGK